MLAQVVTPERLFLFTEVEKMFDAERRSRLRERYVMTQGGLCAICLKPFTEQRRPALDHCHKTDRCRGALCVDCNTGLGRFCDNIEILERAVIFLQRDYSQNVFYPGSEEDRAASLWADLFADEPQVHPSHIGRIIPTNGAFSNETNETAEPID